MKALVLGGARCVWSDVRESEALFGLDWWDAVVACNDIGCHWPRPLDAWCTLHPEKMQRWRDAREQNGHPPPGECIARQGKNKRGIDRTIRHRFGGGSSGLLAVSVAFALGADKIVLCGVPMTKTPHFAESEVHPSTKPWGSANSHWKKWRLHAEKMDGVVKSMGGRTRTLLGPPTLEWMGESDQEEAA